MQLLSRKEVCFWLALGILLAASIDARKYHVSHHARSKTAKPRAQKELKILVDPILKFGSRLLRTMSAEKDNTVFSPVSIHSALSMVLLGATSGSETEEELLKVLNYGPCEKEANRLFKAYTKLMDRIKKTASNKRKANNHSIEVPDPILDIWTMAIAKAEKGSPIQDYLDSIEKYFHSSLKTVQNDKPKEIDNLVGDINKWGEGAGFGKVIEAEELKDDKLALMLLSAVRVEAFWFDHFITDKNQEKLFHNYGTELVKGTKLSRNYTDGNYVNFSTSNDTSGYRSSDSYKELASFDFHAADIPLKGGVSFASFMPVRRGKDKLVELERKLLSADENGMLNLCKTFQVLDGSDAKVTFEKFSIPQYKIDADIDLIKSLKSMSLKRVFKEGSAELSKMYKSPLFVSEVKHQAMIEVNEKGLKAAGITKVSLVPFYGEMPGAPVKLELDHPFLFVVRYNRVPMFLGHLVKI